MNLDAAKKDLEILSLARNGVTLGPVGFASAVTDEYRAYRDLLSNRAALEALRNDLDVMSESGSSGARIYACLLLREVDRDAADMRLEAMCESAEPFTLARGGCVITSSTLGEVASDLLGRARK